MTCLNYGNMYKMESKDILYKKFCRNFVENY